MKKRQNARGSARSHNTRAAKTHRVNKMTAYRGGIRM